MEKEQDVECGTSASCTGNNKSKLDTLSKDDLIKFTKKQMGTIQKLKSRYADLEGKFEALKAAQGGTSDDSVIQELTERMDVVLLEKAETQQMLVLLRKENEMLRSQAEETIEKFAAVQQQLEHAEKEHTKKIKHMEEEFKFSETKHREELEVYKKLASENEENQRQKLEDVNSKIKAVCQEYESKISDLKQSLELSTKEWMAEKETHQLALRKTQDEIDNFQEMISKLNKQHDDEVRYLEEQLEINTAQFDMERERLLQVQEELSDQIALKESHLQDVQEEEEDLNKRTQNVPELTKTLDFSVVDDPESEMDKLRLVLQDLQSQNTMLKEELTFLSNMKTELEGDMKHLKEEFSMEKEELEFKINELQMTKEEDDICPEKEINLTNSDQTIHLEEHKQLLQELKELHKVEMKNLEARFISSNESQKQTITQELQDLQNSYRMLSEEKKVIVSEYEHTQEILRNIEMELGEKTSEFVKKYNAMKEQAALSIQEFEIKLREKDDMIEKLKCLEQTLDSDQKLCHKKDFVPEDKELHMLLTPGKANKVTLEEILPQVEKTRDECKNVDMGTSQIILQESEELLMTLEGAFNETTSLRSYADDLESQLSLSAHEKELLDKRCNTLLEELSMSKEETAKLERDCQSALQQLDPLRKELKTSEGIIFEAQKQICHVLAQNYSVNLDNEEDLPVLLNHLLSRVKDTPTGIVSDEEKAKLLQDLQAASDEMDDLKKVIETSDRKLSDARQNISEILEHKYSVNVDEEEDLSVLLNYLLSKFEEDKTTIIVSHEKMAKLHQDLQTVSVERNDLKKVMETSEKKLSDARKNLSGILEEHYSEKMLGEDDDDIATLLNRLLSCIKEGNEEKMKHQSDLVKIAKEADDLKRCMETQEKKLSDTHKNLIEILEEHYSVKIIGEDDDMSILLNLLLSCIKEGNEEKMKQESDLEKITEERDDLKRCMETQKGKLFDVQKNISQLLKQRYSMNFDEEEDISVLLNNFLVKFEEDKSISIVSIEKNAELQDLQAVSDERDDLKKVIEISQRKLSDAQKNLSEILQEHYSVKMLGEDDDDISILLNHLLSCIEEGNEEKLKQQSDLVKMAKEADDLKRCMETQEIKLSDAHKNITEMLEEHYSVKIVGEGDDMSILLNRLLSCIKEGNEEEMKQRSDLEKITEERDDLKRWMETQKGKLFDVQKNISEILKQRYSMNFDEEEDISVLLNHFLVKFEEDKSISIVSIEEKSELQQNLQAVSDERNDLKKVIEISQIKLSDARKKLSEILEEHYSVKMLTENDDISILLNRLLSCIEEGNEEKLKQQSDLVKMAEEADDLKRCMETQKGKLLDVQKNISKLLKQKYSMNLDEEEDISALLNHFLIKIEDDEATSIVSDEEKSKLQQDLQAVSDERNDLKKVIETSERKLSDARKNLSEILEEHYSVNLDEEEDMYVLLNYLLSKVQEEKMIPTQQLDIKPEQFSQQTRQAEPNDGECLQNRNQNEVLPDTKHSKGEQNELVEIAGQMVGQEPADEGGAQETDDMKSLQQKLSEKESIVSHLKEEVSHLQKSKLSALNENMRQIEHLEKESKEKEERLNKFKAVAVKARKELENSKKEISRLKEELEAVRAERDKMSDSMKAIIHGAEAYKNLMIDYDKQTELLDKEKEKLEASEKLVGDLTKRLHVALEQHKELFSEREDLTAHIETLQNNVRQLEAQTLEMHKLKSSLERDLESERLLKEQKTKEHACAVNEVDELQVLLQKHKQQLQQTEHELEQLRKDAKQSTLLDMEMADYERLVKELNLQLSEKDRLLEEQERQTQAQTEREEKLNQEIESLKSLVDASEEKTAKVKQLLVKTKKDLADAKKEETSQMLLQSSLKGELEAIQQQLENYKIQCSELTADRQRLREQLKLVSDQQQKSVTFYQHQVTSLQNELSSTKTEFEATKVEFESYKVRVHNVLKQQKSRRSTQSDADFSKQDRENMESLLEQLKSKLQESQLNAQSCNAELQQLQTEYDTLLERHNKMLQQTITKEAELRERLLSLHSENVALKAEHSQSVAQLTVQTETLRGTFREQLHHLQDEHRSTVETLQHQVNSLETQLFRLQKELATSAVPQLSKKPQLDKKLADLPLFEMNMAREEGEGMEMTEHESVSTAGTPPPSLEQLLTSPDPKHEPVVWQVELTKEELSSKLNTATRSMEHVNSLLHESEATNAILIEQINLLKSEMRRLERNQEREKSVANLEYLKNVLLQFIFLHAGSEKQALLPVIHTMLQLSPEEKSKLSAIAHGEEEPSASRGSGWTSYLHSWSGIR